MKLKNTKRANIILAVGVLLLLTVGFVAGVFVNRQLHSLNTETGAVERLLDNLAENETCYVIGHKSPDTDTVCSAILLSDILNNCGIDCEAVISGKINNETKFVLENYGISVPEIMENSQGKKMILVDHRECSQMIDGITDTDIIGVFDHHGVGNIETSGPIVYEALNVGSTATVIYQLLLSDDLSVSKKAAYLITSAILSDTKNLTSSTTTELDRELLIRSAKIAGISDVDAFYQKMSEAAESYEGMTDEEIFLSDYKEYEMSGTAVGIACINASNGEDVEQMKGKMMRVMEETYEKRGMVHLFAVIKNGKDNQSIIVGFGDGSSNILTQAFGSTEYVFNPAASRKKDIVPKLEEIYKSFR